MWNLMMQNFVENVQKPATTKFSPSFFQFIVQKTSSVPRRYNYIWQGQRVEIMSMKLEGTQIHFLSLVFIAVTDVLQTLSNKLSVHIS